jgi:hypothetical protein
MTDNRRRAPRQKTFSSEDRSRPSRQGRTVAAESTALKAQRRAIGGKGAGALIEQMKLTIARVRHERFAQCSQRSAVLGC